MVDYQFQALLQELKQMNALLGKLVRSNECTQLTYENVTVGDISQTLASLVFFDKEPGAGDVIVTTEESAKEGRYFKKGIRGLIVRDGGDNDWYVEFRYQGNNSDSYRDGGGANGGRWYVAKDKCKLASKA